MVDPFEWLHERLGADPVAPNGESVLAHARGTAEVLRGLAADETTLTAAALFGGVPPLKLDQISAQFGTEVATLVEGVGRLIRLRSIGALAIGGGGGAIGGGAGVDAGKSTKLTKSTNAADSAIASNSATAASQLETLRRMLLAMSTDIRVVLLRLASRLQTLRYHAATKRDPEPGLAKDSLEVLAPLANRLGLWQLKWELEDLAFRFLDPEQYRRVARLLEERRVEREQRVAQAIDRLNQALKAAGIVAQVSGRAKHIYSIASKMRAKNLQFDEVQDLRAFRVIVGNVRECYTVLSIVNSLWQAVPGEYDDYIARPKPNGYRSLHTVVSGEDGRAFEIQIRTQEMHEYAEYGAAAHWLYKERSVGLAGAAPNAQNPEDSQRIAWVRQLLAWERDVGEQLGSGVAASLVPDQHLYVLTPQARVLELPMGSTPLDFAYQIHTELGHKCRGARVDGVLVPLETTLRNGQTVEILTVRNPTAGPSRDWLNPERRYLASPRARAKVRQWFNGLDIERDIASGRAVVERALAREGRTVLPFDTLAHRLALPDSRALFIAMAREDIGSRALEEAIRANHDSPGHHSHHGPHGTHGQYGYDPHKGAGDGSRDGSKESAREIARLAAEEAAREVKRADADALARMVRARPGQGAPTAGGSASGVLVVGVDVLSQLARCCRPVPPDSILGFVTRGRGITVHRADCQSFAQLVKRVPERVLEAAWDSRHLETQRRFPLDLLLRANDRPGLLRDVSDVLARDRINVTALQTQTRGEIASMRFTVEVSGREQAQSAMSALRGVSGVLEVGRRT